MSDPQDDPFEQHLAAWRDYCETPWGRIRFAVVADVLARHVEVLAGRAGRALRVLDVGGGDGRDSLPLAAAGHEVVVLDTAAGMLAEADRRAVEAGVALRTRRASLDDLPADDAGSYDLVLCHFVLHYRSPDDRDLERLVALLAPGGRLSVVAPQPAGRVLATLVRRGASAARAELDSDGWASVTFGGHEGRRLGWAEVEADLDALGLAVRERAGGRVANDLLTDDAAKQDPERFADLLDLELALSTREPFWRTGQFWHLVAEKR